MLNAQCLPVLTSLDLVIEQLYLVRMVIRKAFKYRLKATPEVEEKCAQMVECCRLVWNKALALN